MKPLKQFDFIKRIKYPGSYTCQNTTNRSCLEMGDFGSVVPLYRQSDWSGGLL
jgi:hypothetical protein